MDANALASIEQLVVEWKQLRDEEDRDEWGRERASKLDDCIHDVEALLQSVRSVTTQELASEPPFDDWASHIAEDVDAKSRSQLEFEIEEALKKAWSARSVTPQEPLRALLDAWERFDSEAADQNPAPDFTLRNRYRAEIRQLVAALKVAIPPEAVTPQEPAHGTRLVVSALREEDRDGGHVAADNRAATGYSTDDRVESENYVVETPFADNHQQQKVIATPPEAHSDDVEGELAPFLPGRNPRTYTFLADEPAIALAGRNTELAAEVERLRADLAATAQARDDWRKLYEMSQPDAILKGARQGTVPSRGEPG
jgi:hypothetical protein